MACTVSQESRVARMSKKHKVDESLGNMVCMVCTFPIIRNYEICSRSG